MTKRIISLLTALILVLSACYVTTFVYANDVVDSTLTLDATSSTAKRIYFTGTDSVDINSTIRKFEPNSTSEGIIVNSSLDSDLFFVKTGGKWRITLPSDAVADTTVTVKGTFTYKAGSISVRFATISLKYTGSAWEVIETPDTDNIEYNRTFSLLYANDENQYGTSGGIFLSADDTIECDTSWGTFISFNEGENNGVFLNNAKTQVQMRKINTHDWYVCLSDAGITAQKDDVITVKGSITYKGKTAIFNAASFVFDGTTWALKVDVETATFEPYYFNNDIKYGDAKGIYLTSDDSIEHDISWATFISFDAGADNGVFLNNVKTNVKMKKFTKADWYVCLQDEDITAQTGDIVTVKGTITFKGKKVLFEAISLVFNGTTWGLVDDPNLETGRTLTLGTQLPNPENGILLIGDDSLAAPGWEQNIYNDGAADSGVFLNGTKTEAFLKKIERQNWYVCLVDVGIVAKKNDKVTVKGIFTYGKSKIAFNEVEFTFNGTTWEEKIETQVTSLDFVDLLTISKFNTETKKWEIYLSTTKALPGVDETATFDVLMRIDGKNKTIRAKKSAQQHSFAFEIDSSVIPQNPKSEVALTIKAGKYSVIGQNEKIKLEADTTLYFANAAVSFVSSNLKIDEKDITFTLDRSQMGGGTKDGIYLTADDNVPYDTNWATLTEACEGRTNGVFLNGVKTSVFLKKYEANKYYVCLTDVNVVPQEGDIVSIKGAFKTNSYISSYKEYILTFKEGAWVDGTEPETNYTKVQIKDYDSTVSGYFNQLNRWHFYFSTKQMLPGNPDQVFNSVTVKINNKEYTMPCYHTAHRDYFLLIIESDKLGKNDTAKVEVSGKAKSEDRLIGMDVQKFTFYVNKYGVSLEGYVAPVQVKEKNVALTLDTTSLGWIAGTQSGIYFFTKDGFAVDETWATPIRAVGYDDNSGVFYNGVKIDAVFKKYKENCTYLDIAMGGVFAKNRDKITIKGTFALNGYGVSYKEVTFYYNGQSWATTYKAPLPKTEVKLTPIGIKPQSSYNKDRKAWDVYVQMKEDVPGTRDHEYKSLTCEVNGQTIEVNLYKVDDSLVFFVPDTILPEDAKDGSAITLKKGKASDNFGLYDVNVTKDYTAYLFRKGVSSKKPTNNTKYLDIEIPGLLRTCTFNEDLKVWQIFFKVDKKFDVVDGTPYYDLPVRVNGKTSDEIGVFRSGECLYIAIPETVLPKNAKTASLTLNKGDKAIANSGWNGIRLKNAVSIYLFDGVWNNVKFTKHQDTDLTLNHINTAIYNSEVKRWDIYVNTDKEVPGSSWFEYFDGVTAYLNGKKFKTYANKADSANNRLIYFALEESVFGKFKNGDVVYIPAGGTYSCGGYRINNMRDFYLQYLNGTWFEYYKSDVKAPKAEKSIWENNRIEGYIPVQEKEGIMFTNVEPTNIIRSVEDVKDITFTFETTKKLAYNEELPTNSIILRGQPLTEGVEVSETALYGYNISFSYIELNEERMPNNPELWGVHSQEIAVWKNGINYSLLDQYRMCTNWKKSNHPFFKSDEKYEYTISIYNVEEDVCVIEIYCNDELVMRVVDHGTDDPLDPVYNAGEMRIYASCPQYFNSPAVELETLEVSQKECYLGEQVRVSATYPAILEGAEYTVDGEGATIKDGVFIATKEGTYTVTGTYNGKDKGSVQIKVSKKPVMNQQVEETSSFPIIPVAIGGGALILVAAAVLVIIFLKKKKAKSN